MNRRFVVVLLGLLAAALLLEGCASPNRRSVAQVTPQQYLVKRGDTLSSIAWRFQLDYRHLAYWNRMSSPYTIHPGQRIYLSPPPGRAVAKAPIKQAPAHRSPSGSGSPSVSTYPQPAPSIPQPSSVVKPQPKIYWQWPTKGRVVRQFSLSGSSGLDIRGVEGQTVAAAAPGSVVYSGAGLKGYGELIIIKHSDSLLSAYAHNRSRFVREGDAVSRGQKIAELGKNDSNNAILHFEIRRNGKPVNPVGFLPKIKN